jgi:hypothetical protein
LTVTLLIKVELQPFVIPVTVYVVLPVGETEMLAVEAPLLQLYVVAPDAVKAAELPEQMVELLAATVGVAFTVTLTVFELIQPFVVPVTV